MFKFKNIEKNLDGPDMTPLLDVVFILLIFFIIAAAFAIRGIDMHVPSAKSSSMVSGRIVEIMLDAEGNIYAENIKILPHELKFFIQRTSHSFIEKPGQMLLKVDPKTPAQALIWVVDEVRKQGGERIIIATSDPDSETK